MNSYSERLSGKKGGEKLETRPTRASRKDALYLLPLVAIVLGLVFLALNTGARPPYSTLSDFLWYGGMIFLTVGIGGAVVALTFYIDRRTKAKV
jgi:hypothetical protein